MTVIKLHKRFAKNVFWFRPRKIRKWPKTFIFNKKWPKNENFWSKNCFSGIDSECFETYFKTKISKSKMFSPYKIFSSELVVLRPNAPFTPRIWTFISQKSRIFWSCPPPGRGSRTRKHSDSVYFRTYFNLKSRNPIFSLAILFLGLSHFSSQIAKIVKKWESQKNLVENCSWLESIQHVRRLKAQLRELS